MAVDVQYYEKKKQKLRLFSLLFLIGVILLSIGFYLYTHHINSKVDELSSQLTQIKESVSEIEQQKEIVAYKLYQTNAPTITQMQCASQITDFITHVKRISTKYGLKTSGFEFSNEKIQTQVEITSDTNGNASDKLIAFLRDYPSDESAIFDIEPIGTFTGQDTISFPLTFTLNSAYYETCSSK